MIEGGPWDGTSVSSGIIIASGDRVAADIVGLGLIRSFGRWQPVTEKAGFNCVRRTGTRNFGRC